MFRLVCWVSLARGLLSSAKGLIKNKRRVVILDKKQLEITDKEIIVSAELIEVWHREIVKHKNEKLIIPYISHTDKKEVSFEELFPSLKDFHIRTIVTRLLPDVIHHLGRLTSSQNPLILKVFVLPC